MFPDAGAVDHSLGLPFRQSRLVDPWPFRVDLDAGSDGGAL